MISFLLLTPFTIISLTLGKESLQSGMAAPRGQGVCGLCSLTQLGSFVQGLAHSRCPLNFPLPRSRIPILLRQCMMPVGDGVHRTAASAHLGEGPSSQDRFRLPESQDPGFLCIPTIEAIFLGDSLLHLGPGKKGHFAGNTKQIHVFFCISF